MTSSFYDPERKPNASEWLTLGEAEQLRLVKNFHDRTRLRVSDAKRHAASHVVVETQIATGFGPSCRAAARLQEQGLTRHEAIHAIAAVVQRCLAENPWGTESVPAQVMQTRMNKEIDALSAATVRGVGKS